jgi:hypothetical protein
MDKSNTLPIPTRSVPMSGRPPASEKTSKDPSSSGKSHGKQLLTRQVNEVYGTMDQLPTAGTGGDESQTLSSPNDLSKSAKLALLQEKRLLNLQKAREAKSAKRRDNSSENTTTPAPDDHDMDNYRMDGDDDSDQLSDGESTDHTERPLPQSSHSRSLSKKRGRDENEPIPSNSKRRKMENTQKGSRNSDATNNSSFIYSQASNLVRMLVASGLASFVYVVLEGLRSTLSSPKTGGEAPGGTPPVNQATVDAWLK